MDISKKIISVEEFNSMKEIFNDKIKNKVGEAYSDYVSMTLEELKAYIEMLEQQADDNGAKTKDIVFHFVSENDDKGQLTLVLEGTFDKEGLKAPLMNKFYPCPPMCGKI